MKINIIYRVCDTVQVCSARKRCFDVSKAALIRGCFSSLCENIRICEKSGITCSLTCVCDRCTDDIMEYMRVSAPYAVFHTLGTSGNAASFCECVNLALCLPDDEVVLFLEDDYLFLSAMSLANIAVNMSILSTYENRHVAMMPDDYPDRWIDNTYVGTARITPTGHFIKIKSTTCTFAAYVDDIKAFKDSLLGFSRWPYVGEAETINKMWESVPLYQPLPAYTMHCQTLAQIPIYMDFKKINEYFKKNEIEGKDKNT